MPGKVTRSQAAAPAGSATAAGGRPSKPGAALRAGDWEVNDGLLAAMGLLPSGDDDRDGADGGEQDGRCAMPAAPTAGVRTGASHVDAPAARSRAASPPAGSAAMWQHILGERSSAVGKLARVSAPKGVRLRTGAAANQPDLGILPFDELVSVERRTEHGWCWVVPMGAHAGSAGFCEEQFLAIDPPEPTAHLVRVAPGEQLRQIAQRHYGQHLGDDHDARLYVQALVEANRGRKGIFLSDVELTLRDRVLRGDDEERTLKTYLGAHVREGHTLWMPSEAFIAELRKRGDITSGSTELSQAWRGAKKAVSATIDAGTYGAAFVVGLLEGSWSAVAELFQGAAEMIELVARTAYQVITGNLGAITATLLGWVEKLKGAWAGRDKIADDFLRKWESEDAWTRGSFQGEVLGWVMMTVLLILATAGSASLAMAGGRWASVLQALRTVDALGDITTYVGKVARLPFQAASVIRRKLGKGANEAAHLAEEALDAERDAARAISQTEEAGEVVEAAKRGKKGNKPKLETITESLDGHTFHNDIRKMSPSARHVIRQLEAKGWVRVAEILPSDLVEISKWFGKEIGVVQSPYGNLRVILGQKNGVATKQLRKGEVFVVHTHPVLSSVKGHFDLDIPNAGTHTEAVVDWSGQITYFNHGGIKNPTGPSGRIAPLLGYQAAFLGKDGAIIGFSRVDIVGQATGKFTIRVTE